MSANTPKTLEQLKAEQRERYVRKQLQNGVSEEQWTSKLWTELSDKEKADLKNKVAQARQAQRNPEAKAEPASAQSEALGS
ncbi:MAG: hypothetical protein EBX40_05215, partial [Gammaproteobacteria bacterium]|nr:hypothetical protein [Gammaproteobacteria bacterium]